MFVQKFRHHLHHLNLDGQRRTVEFWPTGKPKPKKHLLRRHSAQVLVDGDPIEQAFRSSVDNYEVIIGDQPLKLVKLKLKNVFSTIVILHLLLPPSPPFHPLYHQSTIQPINPLLILLLIHHLFLAVPEIGEAVMNVKDTDAADVDLFRRNEVQKVC